jgi:hypothetical protein
MPYITNSKLKALEADYVSFINTGKGIVGAKQWCPFLFWHQPVPMGCFGSGIYLGNVLFGWECHHGHRDARIVLGQFGAFPGKLFLV